MTVDDLYQKELENYIFHFMNELSGLLELNETNEIQIDGCVFHYYISRDINDNIVLTKENKKTKKIIRFNLQTKSIVDSCNSDINLINEFYNLFIQKLYSRFLTKMYNMLTEQKIEEMTVSPKNVYESFYFWTIKKSGKFCLTIKKYNILKDDEEELILKKIDKIPNWFIISKDESFFSISVNRLLTFYKTEKLITDLLGKYTNEKNPYELQYFLTTDEIFISDFCTAFNNTKYYYSYNTRSERKCPYCNTFLIMRTGKYGDFLGCQNYPSCKYTEKINK